MDMSPSCFGQVEDVLMAIVNEPFRLKRLKVAGGNNLAGLCCDCNRLDPMKSVLKNEQFFG